LPFLEKRNNDRIADALLFGGDEYTETTSSRHRANGVELPPPLAQQQRHLCGNTDCAGGWTMPWRSRRRPIFEGRWGCSGRCVLSMVRRALHREAADGVTAATPHRHRLPLGLLMLSQRWITKSQLQQALEAQRKHGTGRIGEWLISECGVDAEQITRGLSMQWSCPVLSAEGFRPEAMALVMPRMFVEQFGLLPLKTAASRIIYLAFEDCLDASAALAIEQMTGLKAESGVLNEAHLRMARRKLLQCEAVETKLESSPDVDALSGRITAILEHKQPVASRLVRLHQFYWLRLWLENGARGRLGTLPFSGEDMLDYVFTAGLQS
jgi:hypothetical protein